MTRFQGKVALISAVGAGIGRATAMIIAREGGTVAGVDVEPAALDRLSADVVAAGARSPCAPTPWTRHRWTERSSGPSRPTGASTSWSKGVGGSTVVTCPAAALDELALEEWQKLLHFNLTGTFLFCHAVIPVMKR